MNDRKPWLNDSGCSDPTAYEALKSIINDEEILENKVRKLVKAIKFIVKRAGFELIGRIQIKDKKSGKEFR